MHTSTRSCLGGIGAHQQRVPSASECAALLGWPMLPPRRLCFDVENRLAPRRDNAMLGEISLPPTSVPWPALIRTMIRNRSGSDGLCLAA